MTPRPTPRLVRAAYRAILAFAPRVVQRAYGPDMRATFEALYAEASARGRTAVLRLLLRETVAMWSAARMPTHHRPWDRAARRSSWWHWDAAALARDVRYGLRTLRRERSVTLFAILIAGVGIGVSTSVFSIVDTLLIRPLPFHDPDRLVWVANGTSENLSAQTVQVSNLEALRTQSRSFVELAGFSPFYGTGDIRLTGAGEPERLTAVPVTDGFFTLLGVHPHVGRLFTAEECRWNAPKTAILDFAFWQRRFAADPGVIGRSIRLDGIATTVVGVLPPSFDFASTLTPGRRVDLFVPFPLSPETNRRGNTLAVIGRLHPGVDLRTAQAEASVVGDGIRSGRTGDVWRNPLRPVVSSLRDRVSGPFRPVVLALAGAVTFLMLLVCANLSNLLLTRASSRQRDIAVRTALGAERYQVIRQLLVESLLLAGGGAALGLAIAAVVTRTVSHMPGTSLPLLHDLRLDGRTLAFTVLAAVLTGVICGLLPALQTSRRSPQHILKHAGRGGIGASSGWTPRVIVVAEVALVCVLLSGAGLLTRSLIRVLDAELGFDAGNVMTIRVDPARTGTTREGRIAYLDEIVRSVRAVPGVEALGLTDALPFGDNFGWRRWNATAGGRATDRGEPLSPLVRMIDEGYLAAMKIPLRAGRAFTAADAAAAARVVIVNEALAEALWPGEDPVGRTLQSAGRECRVVGVVSGVRYFAPERDSGEEMYFPIRQTGDFQVVDLVVASAVSPQALAASVREALRRVDPQLPATEFRTMPQLVDRAVFARRMVVLTSAAFAGFGLMLASVGMYAVISYAVSQRRHEIGIRMALGAAPQSVMRSVLAQTLALAGLGLIVGLPASWIAGRAIRGLLFGVDSFDPLTLGAVLALLTAVPALAGYLPARQAARVDPIAALRAE